PPRFAVSRRRDLAGEHLPPPLIDEQTERQERDLVERARHQQADVARRVGRLVEQPDPHEVLRRDRQRDGVADRFVEAVVRAVAEEHRQILVGALIEVVPELVVDRREVVGRLLDAHLDAQVALEVDVPRARVADDVAIARTDEERSLPERVRQRGESERRVEALARSHHVERRASASTRRSDRSEEHTSELQSLAYLVCRLLLEKKKYIIYSI